MKTRNLKRLMSWLLCLCMVVGLLPGTAWAAPSTQVMVNGVDITAATGNTVACGGGSAVYDPGTNTLTLDSAAISAPTEVSIDNSTNTCGIYADGDLNLVLAGNSTVQSSDTAFYCGVYIKGSLTVSGDGSLDASGRNYGVYVNGKMTVESGSIDGASRNGSTSDCRGIFVSSNLTVSGGSVTGTCTGADESYSSASGVVTRGDLTVTGGSVTGTANSNDLKRRDDAIISDGDITVSGGSVTGSSQNGDGIYLNGYLKISGGTVTVTNENGTGRGIYASKDITITGAPDVTAKAATAGQAIRTNRNYKLMVGGIRYEPLETATEFTVVDGAVTGGAQKWTLPVWVNGVKISADPDHTVECGDGTAKYDPDSHTLTLTNATIKTPYEDNGMTYGIYAEGGLTLQLEGTNTIDPDQSGDIEYGVYIDGNLTVSGEGTLAAVGTMIGIYAAEDLTVSGGAITGTSSDEDGAGITVGSALTVQSGSVTGSSTGDDGLGIYAGSALTVSGGSVSGTASGKSSDGIYVASGDLTVSGSGSVKGTANGISGNGISVMNGDTTVESGSVEGTATGNGGNGISVRLLDVKSGTVTGANNGSDITYGRGISVSSTMMVSGGTVTGTSNAQKDNGIHVTSKELAVSGGTVTGTANGVNGYGIYADDGDILITGNSNVTATSATPGKTVEIEEDSELLVGGKRYVPSAAATTFSVVNGQVSTGADIWTPEIWVNGEKIPIATDCTVQCGTGTAKYDSASNTLTLTNATIDTAHGVNLGGGTVLDAIGIYADSGLTLVLAGSSTVESTNDEPFVYGVYVDGSLTVKGDGSLTADGNYGIYVKKNMTVESGAVEGTSTTTDSRYAGIGVLGALTVSGGSVTGTGTGSSSYGIRVRGALTVSGGSVSGEGSEYGISVEDSLDVSGSGSVTGKGTKCGISVSDLTANGGSVSGEGTKCGISVSYLTANGGIVSGKGAECGISGLSLAAKGGSVTGTATGESGAGIYALIYLGVNAGSVTGTAEEEGGWGLYTDGLLNFAGGTIHGKGSEAAIVAFAYGNHTAGELITLPEDCVLDGYEMNAVSGKDEDGSYTIVSFVEAGGELEYDQDTGTITGAVKEITLTAPDDPGTDPGDPGTDPGDPGTDPGDPGTDPGTDPGDPGTDLGDQPGGGSSSDGEYLANVNMSAGGKVNVNPGWADEGDTVTLTVKPDSGYELSSLTVTDAKGNELKLSTRDGVKYTFIMPGTRVDVKAAFQPVVTAPVNPFTDVSQSDYYYDAVLWAVEKGVTSGISAAAFGPNVTVTRAQAMTFLWRAHGSPKATGANPFTDVSTSDYYYDAVLWAVANGITGGTGAATFGPDAPVTRAQAMTFQWRAAGSPQVSAGGFSDVSADAYYAQAVTWAVANGITAGTGGSSFSPDMAVTRAQAMTFLWKELA